MTDTIKQKRHTRHNQLWPKWISRFREQRLLLLPGIMGSQLFDYKGDDTVWVDWGLRERHGGARQGQCDRKRQRSLHEHLVLLRFDLFS